MALFGNRRNLREWREQEKERESSPSWLLTYNTFAASIAELRRRIEVLERRLGIEPSFDGY